MGGNLFRFDGIAIREINARSSQTLINADAILAFSRFSSIAE